MTATQIINPATEEVIDSVDLASVEEVDAAIDSAQRAYAAWRAVDPADRARLLRQLSLIHISEPTRPCGTSRMPSSA